MEVTKSLNQNKKIEELIKLLTKEKAKIKINRIIRKHRRKECLNPLILLKKTVFFKDKSKYLPKN